MGVGIMLRKKDFIPEKSVAVETKWWRIALIDTPESNLIRRYMREEVGRDPLSSKTVSILKAHNKNNNLVKNRQGNAVYLATYCYTDSTTKDELEVNHRDL